MSSGNIRIKVPPMTSAAFLISFHRKRMMHHVFSVVKYSYYGHSEKQKKIQCSQAAASCQYCILNSFLNSLSESILKTGHCYNPIYVLNCHCIGEKAGIKVGIYNI